VTPDVADVPETRYAKSGDVHIAYATSGEGPLDLVFVPGFVSHLEYALEEPSVARFMRRLGSFTRVVAFDKRGTGLSDRSAVLPTMDERMDDIRAVMDAASSTQAALFGVSEGGPLTLLFAATYPDRAKAIVLYGSHARFLAAPDYPWGVKPEQLRSMAEHIEPRWGTGVGLGAWAPSMAGDRRFRDWWARFQRLSASPSAAVAQIASYAEIDVRDILPLVTVPALIIHRTGDRMINVEAGRYLADRLPNARFVELPGDDHFFWTGDQDTVLEEIEEFLTGARSAPEPDRVLASVLFTDIVGSTEQAASLGDRTWRGLLDAHDTLVRRQLERFRGREVHTTGDGFLATFDGPARGIRCAQTIVDGVRSLGLEVRAGLHAGECELRGQDVGGLAVHIAARVGALAGPGEVLVSSTVKDLVAGSGIEFLDRGEHALRGVPGTWRLFTATA
jgi:pimeloyl-ACP methyl ester carboxylesterase